VALDARKRASLNQAENMFGRLGPEPRVRLRAVMDGPTQETWDAAYSLIINAASFCTLWQAVLRVDPDFPRSRGEGETWARVPSQHTILRALERFAGNEEQR
jgi:hypothetical protein